MKTGGFVGLLVLLCGCGAPPPPKSTVPALNPAQAYELLRYYPGATEWLTHVQRENPTCNWHVDLPDQASEPTEIDLSPIVWCGNAPAPLQYKASAVFTYDKTAGWKLSRFSN